MAADDLDAAYEGLFMAAEHGRADVLKALLEHGKDVLDLPQIRNASGLTPLHVAVIYQKADAVRALLAAGFPADAVVLGANDSKYAGMSAYALAANQAPVSTMMHVFLQYAIQEIAANHMESVACLLRAGIDPITATDGSPLDNSLLHWAACSNATDVAALLLRHVQDDQQRAVFVNRRNADGATALHDACYGNHVSCVQLLVDHGADLSVVGTSGYVKDKMAVEVASSSDITRIVAKARFQRASALSSPRPTVSRTSTSPPKPREVVASGGEVDLEQPVPPLSPPRSTSSNPRKEDVDGPPSHAGGALSVEHTSVLLEEKQALIDELKHTIDGLVTESHDRQLLGEETVVLEFIRKLREEKQAVERHLHDAEDHIVAQEEIMMELKAHIRRHNTLVEDLKLEIRTLQQAKYRTSSVPHGEDAVVVTVTGADDSGEPRRNNPTNGSSHNTFQNTSVTITTDLEVPLPPSPTPPPTPSFWSNLLYYLWPFADEETLPSMTESPPSILDATILTV